jgi:alpha-glucosidase
MTVGELFDGTLAEAVAYANGNHMIFDFQLIGLPWDAPAFRDTIARRDAAFGPAAWPTNVMSNHDQPRHAGSYDDPADPAVGDARAKVAAALILTLRGTPFLYYGEELGLRNLVVPNEIALDPQARRAGSGPAWNRDQARGPLPWNGGPGGGFTSGRPWLPLPPDVASRNVEREAADAASVLSFYRTMLHLRRGAPALTLGSQQLLDAGDPDVLAYRRDPEASDRRDGAPAAFIALNFAARQATIRLPDPAPGRAWRISLSTHGRRAGEALDSPVILAPHEALIAYD